MEEKEVRPPLLRLVEDLLQGGEGDQDVVNLSPGISEMQPAVVPLLGEGEGGDPLHCRHYVPHACHHGTALYNPRVLSPAREKLAQAVSAATRLPLLAVPLFPAVGAEVAGGRGALWGLACLSLTSGLSLLYLLYLTRSGKVRDPRAIPQAERVRPLRVVALVHAGAFLLVSSLGAPLELRAVLLSYALATAVFALLTPLANLSLHAAGVSGAAVCLIYVFGVWGLPAVLLVPLVWWARGVLGRHTPLELALGLLVGAGGTWISFALMT